MEVTSSNIYMRYEKNEVLKNVSIQARNSQFIGIIGPNGSGKSTFLKCIYRVLKPEKGAIYLDQRELSSLSVKESAKKIAVVAQHNFYNFD